MSCFGRSALLLLVVFASCTLGALECSVAGRVSGPDGRPLPSVRLELASSNQRITAETDGDGGFRFDKVQEGKFHLEADDAEYLITSNTSFECSSKMTELWADVSLVVGAQVVGTIKGIPKDTPDSWVVASRVTVVDGKRRYQRMYGGSAGAVDRDGRFFVGPLPDGDYIFHLEVVYYADDPEDAEVASRQPDLFMPLYFPGSFARTEAQVYSLKSGDELRLAIQVPDVPRYTLTLQPTLRGEPVFTPAYVSFSGQGMEEPPFRILSHLYRPNQPLTFTNLVEGCYSFSVSVGANGNISADGYEFVYVEGDRRVSIPLEPIDKSFSSAPVQHSHEDVGKECPQREWNKSRIR